jgi:hypothetical protein
MQLFSRPTRVTAAVRLPKAFRKHNLILNSEYGSLNVGLHIRCHVSAMPDKSESAVDILINRK